MGRLYNGFYVLLKKRHENLNVQRIICGRLYSFMSVTQFFGARNDCSSRPLMMMVILKDGRGPR